MFFPATPKLFLAVICFFAVTGITSGNEHGSGVVRVVAEEGSDAILPCSLSTKENIKNKLFDWRKDGGGVWKEVFQYNAGSHSNNGDKGQDEQFRGRVSHFPEQLEFGNASIRIRNTTIDDRGNYTCDFPRLQPRVPTFNVLLVVDLILKDRSGQISGSAAPRPFISISNVTEEGVQLQCVALGASPQPTLRWLDGDGKQLHADKPQISERGGRYDVVLQTTVTETKTSFFYCALEQEELGHAVKTSVTVPEKLFENKSCREASMFTGGLCSGVALTLPAVIYLIRLKKGSQLESRPLGSQLESRPSGSQLESGPSGSQLESGPSVL